MKLIQRFIPTAFLACVIFKNYLYADIIVPGADGSDGAFRPTANVQIDLSQASLGNWDAASTNAGKGIYDSNQWAVIFKYSSVNIPSGVTVTFKNHPSHAPVVWLVSGAVTNNGRLSVDGAAATGVGPAEGGPGGFRGCLPPVAGVTIGSAGFGPGGGNYTDGAGSFGSLGGGNAGPIYGNNRLIPLVGGSGGAPRSVNYVTCHDWTAGGAILVAAANRIQLNGQISAYGGEPTDGCFARGAGGSGGGIRLISQSIVGTGIVRALGGAQTGGDNRLTGGNGRIRLEANLISLADLGFPSYVPNLPGSTALLWPPSNSPVVRITRIHDQDAPLDPHSSFAFPQDVLISQTNAVLITLASLNVPTNWNVQVRIVQPDATQLRVTANFVSGDGTNSVWQTSAVLPQNVSVIQAFATSP